MATSHFTRNSYASDLLKYVVLSALFLSVLFCSVTYADYSFVDIGKTRYEVPVDGVYWQAGHPHEVDVNSYYFRAGKGWKVSDRLDLRVSGHYLGKWDISADTTLWDNDYINGCSTPPCPMAHWDVESTNSGIGLSIKVMLIKSINLAIEAGKTINYSRSSMRVAYENGSLVNGYEVKNHRELAHGSMYGVSMGTEKWYLGAAIFSVRANWTESYFIEQKMPTGVNKVTAVYFGMTF